MTEKKEVLKYKELIAKSNDQLEEERIQLKVEKAQQDVQAVITETKGYILDLKSKVSELILSDDFDYSIYSEAEEELEMYQKGLEKAEKFLKERF